LSARGAEFQRASENSYGAFSFYFLTSCIAISDENTAEMVSQAETILSRIVSAKGTKTLDRINKIDKMTNSNQPPDGIFRPF
jgi:hypothetical protein